MLDDRVRSVLERLEAEEQRPPGVAVAPATAQFLFSIVAPQTDCEVLEIGAGRGYSTIWLAAGVRYFGGRVLSLEHDRAKTEAWRRNVAEAGLDDWAELLAVRGVCHRSSWAETAATTSSTLTAFMQRKSIGHSRRKQGLHST